MSCLERKQRVRHKTSMHGSRKHPDGFGKASCAGSVMDETDREVSSLTDRAFKSLCIGDEAVYIEPVFMSSPAERQRAFMEDANGTEQKNMQGVLQLRAKQEVGDASKRAATFQSTVGDLAKPRNERVPQLSNGAIETVWVQNQRKSKVSSQIKAFATARNDGHVAGDAVRPTDYKQVEVTCQSWDKSALMSIQGELSDFSSTVCPQNFTMGHIPQRKNPSRNKTLSMDMAATSTKSSKGKGRKSSKHKKLITTNFFLHSEFSPFQLWRECKQVPFENSDILSTSNFPKWYDSSLYKELKAAHEDPQPKGVQRRKPTESVIAALMSSTKEPSKAQEVSNQHHSSKDLQRAEGTERRNLSLEYLNKHLAVGKGCPSPKVIQNGKAIDKISNLEMMTTCVPWRKNRSLVKKAPAANRPCTMPPPQERQRKRQESTQNAVLDMSRSIAPFSIAKLLTPTLSDRKETKTLVSLKDTMALAKLPPTPSLETETRLSEVQLRDSYKGMASSLLFNIKDNRKRVKTTYNPPKFKSPDSSGPRSVLTISEASGARVGTTTHPKLGEGKPVNSPALEPSEVRTSDRKELAGVCISDDYLTLSSPPAVEDARSFKSFPGATWKSSGQTQPVGLHHGSSPLTSRDTLQKCLAPDPYRPAGPIGKEIGNGPLMVNASQWSAVKVKESPETEPPLSNGVDFSGDPEAFDKEAKQASNHTIKNGLSERQDLYLDGCGVSGNWLDATTGRGSQDPEGPSEGDRAENPVTTGGKENTQPGMWDRKERDSRKEVGVKRVFSAKQNQYIKNERYAMKKDNGEEDGSTKLFIPRDIDSKSHQSVTQAKEGVTVNREKRGPENDVTPVIEQHVAAVNGDMHDQTVPATEDTVWIKPHALSSGEGELIINKEDEARKEQKATASRCAQHDRGEQVRERENSHLKQTFSKKSNIVYDENVTGQALLPPKSVKRERCLASGKDKAEEITERRQRTTRKDSFAVDSRGHDGEQKQGSQGAMEKGHVRQKVLSYMSMKECVDGLQTEGAGLTTRVQASRPWFTGTDEASVSQRESVGKVGGDGKGREIASESEKGGDLSGDWTAGVSGTTAKECASGGQGRTYEKANGKSNGEREVLTTPVQDSWAEGQFASAREARQAPRDSYLLAMVDPQNKDFKAQPSQQSEDLHTKEDENTTGMDSQMRESQYFSVTDCKSEVTAKDGHVLLLQSEGGASWTGESMLSSGEMDEGGWIRYLIESAKAQSQAPLSPVGKPTLFKVKDNTFRNSPIIRTVKLPFHLPGPEEFCLGSPKESLSGSERGEDEQDRLQDASVRHSIGLTSRPYGVSSRSATSYTAKSPEASGEPRRGHQRRIPIPKEEEGASEQVESCAMIVVGMEEKPGSTVPTEDTTCSEEPSERSESACSAAESRPQSRPPVVPPKTEKALRRAQKLRRNRKVDFHRKSQGRNQAKQTGPKPSQPASRTRSPPTEPPVSEQPVPVSEPASSSCNVPRLTPPHAVNAIVPPCSMTQRKVLQDPDSGQYFVVDMPVQVKTKTFFDPETGMYLQLPVKQSEEASSPVTSGSPPTPVEAPYMLYHGFVPMPVNPLQPEGPACNLSAPVRVSNGQENLENGIPYRQMWDKQNSSKNTGPDGIHGTLHDGSLYSEDRDSISSRNMDVISLGEVDDLAVEN